jgi:uncharacterized protein involved in exopolysaccharide biosynthesis
MNFNFRFYWSLFMRRLPVMLALLLACSGIGLVAALKLPPTWATSAQLLVEAPQIPEAMVGATVEIAAGEQLQVIEQRLMTRANLVDIAQKYRVFSDIGGMNPDEVVKAMREATTIERSSGREQATLMSVGFEAASPQTAASVVNEFVTLILQASSRSRLERAEGTLAFFEQEVKRLSQDLDTQSAQIVAFKNANASALPDDLQYRLGRQALLQERQARLERDRAGLVAQKTDVVTLFQATGRIDASTDPSRLSPDEQRLVALKAELDQARAVLSESNPKMKILVGQIAQLESTLAARISAGTRSEGREPASMLDVTIAEIQSRIDALDSELATTNAELSTLEASINATSSNAIALAALERDYANIQARYNGAVNNLNQARMGERIETTAQGERISVIENAAVPQEPSGPNRKKIAALGIGLGIALAAGWFMLLELLNRTIRQPGEMKGRFGIVPIVSIPYMESRQEKFMRRSILISASLAVLIGVPAGLWYVDTNYMPLELLADKVIDRLGLS